MATVLCAGGDSLHTCHPLLKSAGYDVLTATNHAAVLAAVRLPDIGAVILDSRSTMANLHELAAELKCSQPHLPVLLVTDAGAEDVTPPAAAFDRVISRRDGPVALLATLRELTAGVAAVTGSREAFGTRNPK